MKHRGWMPKPPQITFRKGDSTLVKVDGFGEGWIIGEPSLLDDTMLLVNEVTVYGEGSGTFMREIFTPALAKSTGVLEAVLIWEGGDTISRLVVEDGKVTESDIEL